MKPSSASAVPEAGIVMAAKVSDKGSRRSCHRPFRDQAGVMFAKAGDIDAGCPELDLEGVYPLFILVKLD
jgi:hypothetical protein